jgi:hypothetical protein
MAKIPYPHLFRLLHWALAIIIPLLVLSGLSLHATARPGWSLFSGVLPALFWPGRVLLAHLSMAVVFAPSLVAVVWIYAPAKRRRKATAVVLLCGGLVMVLSALVLLNPVGPPVIYWAARAIHAAVGLVVLPIAYFWHLAHGLGRNRRMLWRSFHPWAQPRWIHLVYFVPVLLVAACLILGGLPVHAPWRELVAKRIAAVDADVVDLAALPWSKAAPLRINLAGGIGFDGGRTQVTFRAMHDGRELFVSAQWTDPIENRSYMPWKKTAGGWQHLMTNVNDESVHYEDKFGLIFPSQPGWQFERFGCAAYCHVGGGRAYGYKGSDRMVDVWHWKSTRSDPVDQVDDKYWSELDFWAKDIGRHGDPKDGGGYKKNFSGDKPHPDFLPDGPAAVKQGIIFTERAVEYTPQAAAKIPAGTIVPGIVAAAARGDRGDVRCQSRYRDGRWQLFIRRKLDTGSRYDVLFVPGRRYPFGCAAFDHSSKRHAYGFGTYRLVLEE